MFHGFDVTVAQLSERDLALRTVKPLLLILLFRKPAIREFPIRCF
jgi:hypothetical protein